MPGPAIRRPVSVTLWLILSVAVLALSPPYQMLKTYER